MAARKPILLPGVVIAWTAAAGGVVAAGAGNPWRALIVLPFLLLIPGLALVPFLRVGALASLTLAIALSLALDGLVPTGMIYAGWWSPDATLGVLLLVSLAGGAAQIVLAVFGPITHTEQTT